MNLGVGTNIKIYLMKLTNKIYNLQIINNLIYISLYR
ncbi:hypothetical protein EMIT0P253_160034 [Pseudomonas sp. IT-P253]